MAEINTTAQQPGSGGKTKKDKKRIIFISAFSAIAIVIAAVWWINYNKYISSDDANLDTYRISISPQVSGMITQIFVFEGDTVKKGDILFSLDSAAIYSRYESALADFQQLEAQTEVARVNLLRAENDYEIAKLRQSLNKKNFNRAKEQYAGDAITLEVYQTQEEVWKSSLLQSKVAQNNIVSARASLNAAILSAQAAKKNADMNLTDLSYYKVTAPADGIIGKRWALPGDVVNAGETVYTLNTGSDIWVAVFLEETKFRNLHINQKVKFTLDAYDKLTFYGAVYYIGDNAASEFALVPPNNASGNFTKVTQRIPIKISIDSVSGDKKQKADYKLISGMSATVKIIKD